MLSFSCSITDDYFQQRLEMIMVRETMLVHDALHLFILTDVGL